MKSNIASANGRAAYQGNIVFTKHIAANTDSWQTGMNNNILVLGCSGSGKTRNHLKPNLMQCQGSYIVLDTKGSLYDEMGAYLALQGYKVDQLDFTTMGGTCGYDPLHQVRIENGKPNQQDIIAIASTICPKEAQQSDPFWGLAAANYLSSYIAYVFGFKGALDSYANPNRIDFSSFGREKRALFVTVDDIDHSLEGLTSLFIEQAFTRLCSSADRDYTEHRLPIPVRFILDDFANLNIPHIDDMLAVIRSREISATIICQTVSQLEARYGTAAANSIIGNCDRQLLLAVQDEATARYFSLRANKPAFALLETPANTWWYFERGKRGKQDGAYQLDQHPEYPFCQAICECKNQLTKDEQFAIPLEDETPWNEESSFELASEENTTNAA